MIRREPLPHVKIHPQDADTLGITNGDLIELFNPYGTVTALAVVTDANGPEHVFMLFEHPRGWLNSLTTDYVDPATTIPYYKGTKAGIRKVGEMPRIKETLTFVPTNRIGGSKPRACISPVSRISYVPVVALKSAGLHDWLHICASAAPNHCGNGRLRGSPGTHAQYRFFVETHGTLASCR